MSQSSITSAASVSLGWWSACIAADNGAARRCRAQLRRASSPSDALANEVTHELHRRLVTAGLHGGSTSDSYAIKLAAMATTMAAVKENAKQGLAVHFGIIHGERRVLSELRFQKLLGAGDHWKLSVALRRSMPIVKSRANVAQLGSDLFFWNDDVRNRWCFQYFGTKVPDSLEAETETNNAEDS